MHKFIIEFGDIASVQVEFHFLFQLPLTLLLRNNCVLCLRPIFRIVKKNNFNFFTIIKYGILGISVYMSVCVCTCQKKKTRKEEKAVYCRTIKKTPNINLNLRQRRKPTYYPPSLHTHTL